MWTICKDSECTHIKDWVNKLKKKIDLFDIDGIKSSLDQFPEILDQIDSILK